MARDYSIMYDPIYAEFGVDAVLTVATLPAPVTVQAIDKTQGVEISGGNAEVATVQPSAMVRMEELIANGVEGKDLKGSTIAFNGKTWRIASQVPVPSPNGETTGEANLVLEELP